jgi:hypothetical protein
MSSYIPLVDIAKPPNWWNPEIPQTPPRPFFHAIEVPAWWSAHRRTFGFGAAEEAAFLAFRHITSGRSYLYLAWGVRYAPASSPDRDRLYVGFAPSAQQPPLLVEVVIYSEDQNLVAAPAARITVGTLDHDGRFESLPRQPAWITETARVWRDTATSQWGVQMRAPLAAGAAPGDDAGIAIDTDGHLRIWYCFDVYTPLNPAGRGASPAGGVLRMGWPKDAASAFAPGRQLWPTAGLYEHYDLGTEAHPEGVSGRGVWLHWLTMGTPSITASEVNPDGDTLFARPTNRTGAEIAGGQLRAQFAIANWGASYANGPAWTPIAVDVRNSAPIGNRKTPVLSEAIRHKWRLPPELADALRNGEQLPHQCVRVELSGTDPALTNPVVSRNVDFASGQGLVREAEVSVVGLAPIDTRPRDVYLAVEVYNLPERSDSDANAKTGRAATLGLTGHTRAGAQPASALEDMVTELNAYTYEEALVPTPEVAQIFLDVQFPTYRVHCWQDTGRREQINGRTYCLLGLLSNFAYHLVPDEAPAGWSHRLRGARRLDENFYVLQVPNDGVAWITTSIQPLEEGEIPEPEEPIKPWPVPSSGRDVGQWIWWLMVMFGIALLLLTR